ncbi:MAG: type VI secretion system contractile sheath large subunit [Pseudomonadota bacterium]
MSESIQKKLLRVRPPRVRITYDVHTNGAIEKRELPFVVGIFADLSGDRDTLAATPVPPEYKERKIVEIDRDNFNDVLKQSMPRVDLAKVEDVLSVRAADAPVPTIGGALVFASMDDFEPIRVVQKVDMLKAIYQRRKSLRDAQARAEVDDVAAKNLDKAIVEMEKCVEDSTIAVPWVASSRSALAALNDALKAIDDAKPTPAKPETLAAPATATAPAVNAQPATAEIPAVPEKLQAAADKLKVAASALKTSSDLLNAAVTAQGALPDGDKNKASAAGLAALTALATPMGAAATEVETMSGALATPATNVSEADKTKLDGHATTLLPLINTLAAPTAYNLDLDTKIKQKLENAFPVSDRFPNNEAFAKDLADALKADVFPVVTAASGKGVGFGSAVSIDTAVAAIDAALSKQLSVIMHSDGFKAMEATWRGLFHLVSRTETSTRLKLRIFNAQLSELQDDMSKAPEFDQSKLFKMIYEAEYGTFGGSPYSMLLGGYEIGPDHSNMTFIGKMAEVAAAAHAPFLAAASPKMFGLDDFGDLARPRDLAKIFEGADLTEWSEFRGTEDSRYVSLVLPKVMLRLPYGQNTLPAEGFIFEEDVLSDNRVPDNTHFLWGNAAYFLAERITNAFSLYSWTAAIRGVEGGGLVEGLPIYTFSSGEDEGIKEIFCPTQVAITDRREKEINDLGFIALCHSKGSGKAAFFGGQTTNKPKKYINADANANAALSSRLPYIMAASRFAHYIKVIVRDKVGGFLTRGNVEAFLNSWISQYVLLDDNASQDVKSAFPLREANIVVVDVPGEPGSYKATVFLKPHFQLEELTTSIRLVADLPK